MKKSRIILLLVAVLMISTLTFARQYADYIRKPLKFTRARQSITVKDTVTANKLVICHDFKARKNQRLTAHIVSDNAQSRFMIKAQEGSDIALTQIGNSDPSVYDYNVLIPATDIYEICVDSDRGRSKYTLAVTLK